MKLHLTSPLDGTPIVMETSASVYVHPKCWHLARSKAGRILTQPPVDQFGKPALLSALCPSCAGRKRSEGHAYTPEPQQ